ncbi:MAG: hypothetical protein GX323_10675 [Clostridiales bacterium]|nr:hypothetical protein [Clostridiales bacterium]
MRLKEIPLIGMLSAILLVVQITIAFLPNIELVSLLIIIYTLVLRKKVFYVLSIFIFLEGLFYGFGLWWFNYLYIWFILALITILLSKETSSLIWALVSGFFGLSFGALCAIPYFFMGLSSGGIEGGINNALAYWISGLPFDLIHGISNFLIALVLFKPLNKLISQFYKRYF